MNPRCAKVTALTTFTLVHIQAPGIMDQVLLEWEVGHSVVLARIKVGEGCWLCSREVYNKLGSSVQMQTWRKYIQGERHSKREPVTLSNMSCPA